MIFTDKNISLYHSLENIPVFQKQLNIEIGGIDNFSKTKFMISDKKTDDIYQLEIECIYTNN